jgi:hypothetical protein
MSGRGRLGPSRQLHVKVPVRLYDKLWEYVKSVSKGNTWGVYTKVVREAIKEYLERRGVKVDE